MLVYAVDISDCRLVISVYAVDTSDYNERIFAASVFKFSSKVSILSIFEVTYVDNEEISS